MPGVGRRFKQKSAQKKLEPMVIKNTHLATPYVKKNNRAKWSNSPLYVSIQGFETVPRVNVELVSRLFEDLLFARCLFSHDRLEIRTLKKKKKVTLSSVSPVEKQQTKSKGENHFYSYNYTKHRWLKNSTLFYLLTTHSPGKNE